MNIGPTQSCEHEAPAIGGGLQVRIGGATMVALPMWSLTNNTSREDETSELNMNSRRYFFDSYLPGSLTGYFCVLSYRLHQLRQLSPKQLETTPTSKPVGFFSADTDDINIDPAFAGSINVLANNNQINQKIPTRSRDFHVKRNMTTMLKINKETKKAPAIITREKSKQLRSIELMRIKEKIELRQEKDNHQYKQHIAEMFLAGPLAWPDFPDCEDVPFEDLEDEDYEEWIPLDFDRSFAGE